MNLFFRTLLFLSGLPFIILVTVPIGTWVWWRACFANPTKQEVAGYLDDMPRAYRARILKWRPPGPRELFDKDRG